MSDLKSCIECTTTWEYLDDGRINDVLMYTEVDDTNDPLRDCEIFTENQDSTFEVVECKNTTSPELEVSPGASVRLQPSLDPEKTKPSRCEVRIVVPPRLHRRIAKMAIRSTARNLEVYDRLGEYILTAKGERGEGSDSDCYTSVFDVKPNSFELVIKFLSISKANLLHLHLLHVFLLPHTWPGNLPGVGTSPSMPSNGLDLHRVQELTNFGESLSPSARQLMQAIGQQQQTVGPRFGPPGSGSLPTALLSSLLARQHLSESRDTPSTSSGDQRTARPSSVPAADSGLVERLAAMEARIMTRLDNICARLSAVEEAVTRGKTTDG